MKAWVLKQSNKYWDGVALDYMPLNEATLFLTKKQCLGFIYFMKGRHLNSKPIKVNIKEDK